MYLRKTVQNVKKRKNFNLSVVNFLKNTWNEKVLFENSRWNNNSKSLKNKNYEYTVEKAFQFNRSHTAEQSIKLFLSFFHAWGNKIYYVWKREEK